MSSIVFFVFFTVQNYFLHCPMDPGLHFMPSVHMALLRFAPDKSQFWQSFVALNRWSWVASKLYPKLAARSI